MRVRARTRGQRRARARRLATRWEWRPGTWRAFEKVDDAAMNAAPIESGLDTPPIPESGGFRGAGEGAFSPRHLCPLRLAFTIEVMGDSRVNLTHHFLIAMPSMADP